jgi:hypothetical protein
MTSMTTWTRFSPWAGALPICASLPSATAFGQARAVANDYVNRSLHARGQRSASQAIKRTWDRLKELRSGLADPVKNNGGQPAIPAAAPLTCHLP